MYNNMCSDKQSRVSFLAGAAGISPRTRAARDPFNLEERTYECINQSIEILICFHRKKEWNRLAVPCLAVPHHTEFTRCGGGLDRLSDPKNGRIWCGRTAPYHTVTNATRMYVAGKAKIRFLFGSPRNSKMPLASNKLELLRTSSTCLFHPCWRWCCCCWWCWGWGWWWCYWCCYCCRRNSLSTKMVTGRDQTSEHPLFLYSFLSISCVL
jgi:hypothetical protein